MDQSVLEALPTPQRQKVTRQLRKEQVKKYLEFIKAEKEKYGSVKRQRGENKKKTRVGFSESLLLQDAVENYDDREVSRLLRKGANKNFKTGNDTTLLHKCVSQENLSTAEMLIREGVDINEKDGDWWTPLHIACSCQSVDFVQLLINNGADVTCLDVDGFFALDHAPEDSETHQVLQQHMDRLGLNKKKLQDLQLKVPRQMYTDVKEHISQGGNPNKTNEQGIAFLHIACANGYRKVIRLLLKQGATVNLGDNMGWTPLHVAARFNQMKTVQSLLKYGADPLLRDNEGNRPAMVAGTDNIRTLLVKAERKQHKKIGWRDSELPDNFDNDKDDDDDLENDEEMRSGNLIRINSKTVRSRHTSIAKEDQLIEAKQTTSHIEEEDGKNDVTSDDHGNQAESDDETHNVADDVYEEIYISKIWRNVNSDTSKLPPVSKNDNFSDLTDISEESVLCEVQKRYASEQIYSFIGDILIAVNPFQDIPIYSKDVSMKYHSKSSVPLPPHVYAVTEQAYKSLLADNASQCCVISGESGAGKTETCKYLIQHLVFIAGSEESNLNNKISQINPLLEAFGNAKTTVNSNSSRFAKFMELSFNVKGKIVGAKMTEFLLEKSRVVYQGDNELNYHIFYWMFSGLSNEEFNLFQIKDITKHRYLTHPGLDMRSLVCTSNREKFLELKQCLHFVGFTTDDIQNILQLLAAMLHLGDITFGSHGNNDAAVVKNMEKLEQVSTMLEVSSDELGSALVAEFTMTRGEQIRKDRTKQQACDCRDALTKAIYSRLFSWIVNGINQMTQPIDPSGDNFQIGILDIFGFENFNRNSFEQICINLANEQMQHYTNEYIFMKEQEDCLLEGIPLVNLDYKNNQPIINAFMEKNVGILAIIDEESHFPKGTDISLATKLHQGPGVKYETVYKAPKDGGAVFTIVHYAGAVKYNLLGVVEKNRDTIPNAVLYTMKTSNSLLIKELFQGRVTRTGSLAPSARQQRSRKSRQSPFDFFKKLKGGGKTNKKKSTPVSIERKGPATMAFHFKNSLTELMSKIQAAKPHIIRCIRPNTEKIPFHFSPEYVLAQMRYTGVTETIKIKKYGYSSRIKFRDFLIVEKPVEGSIDDLDTILSQYDTVPGPESDDSSEDTEYADIANVMSDMSVQQRRGLPPPPCGAYIANDVVPPPSPRQMYSQSGIYDVIPGEQAQMRKSGPAPPKRSSSTRLSTSSRDRVSVSSTSYDDAFIDDHSPQQSPRHSVSQHTNRASSSGPQSPSYNQAKPFSYCAVAHTNDRRMSSDTKYNDIVTSPGSPTYEPIPQNYIPDTRHTNGYHGNRISSGQDPRTVQTPHSPKLHRQSSGGSPGQLRKAPVPVGVVIPPSMPTSGVSSSPSRTHGPPSFPAPPAPVTGSVIRKADQVVRSSSPPLPPPPTEFNTALSEHRISGPQRHIDVAQSHHVIPNEPPTPPPISKIPGTRSSVSSFELGKKVKDGSVDNSPVQSPTHGGGMAAQLNKVKLRAVATKGDRTSQDIQRDFKQDAKGIAAELGQVKLRSSPGQREPSQIPENQETYPNAAGKVKLNPVKNTGERRSPEQEAGMELVLPKLKSTGGPKPWEKDSSPPSHSTDTIPPAMMSSIDDEPLPPPPPELMEDLPPPPMEIEPPIAQSSPVINGTEQKQNQKLKKVFEKDKKKDSSADTMEIDLDEIDYSQIPGYVEITNAVPNWKRDMIIKKNEEKVQIYLEDLRRKKAEEMRWKDVPEWKRKMLEKKDKERREQEEAMTQAAQKEKKQMTTKPKGVSKLVEKNDVSQTGKSAVNQTNVTKQPVSQSNVAKQPENPVTKPPDKVPDTNPQPSQPNVIKDQREEEEQRREEKRRQIEYQAQMEKELADVPEWKREIMMKKGTAPSNWGDEREEINRDDE